MLGHHEDDGSNNDLLSRLHRSIEPFSSGIHLHGSGGIGGRFGLRVGVIVEVVRWWRYHLAPIQR